MTYDAEKSAELLAEDLEISEVLLEYRRRAYPRCAGGRGVSLVLATESGCFVLRNDLDRHKIKNWTWSNCTSL